MATEKLNTGHTITKWTCQKKLDSKWPLFRQRRQEVCAMGAALIKKLLNIKLSSFF